MSPVSLRLCCRVIQFTDNLLDRLSGCAAASCWNSRTRATISGTILSSRALSARVRAFLLGVSGSNVSAPGLVTLSQALEEQPSKPFVLSVFKLGHSFIEPTVSVCDQTDISP